MMQYQLGNDATRVLYETPVWVLEDVVNGFVPKETDTEFNGRLIAFAGSVCKRHGQAGTLGKGKGKSLGEFTANWNLNQDANNILMQLSPKKLTEVICNFTPGDVVPGQEVNGKLINFAKGVLNGKGGDAISRVAWEMPAKRPHVQTFAASPMLAAPAALSFPGGKAAGKAAAAYTPASYIGGPALVQSKSAGKGRGLSIGEFMSRWQL